VKAETVTKTSVYVVDFTPSINIKRSTRSLSLEETNNSEQFDLSKIDHTINTSLMHVFLYKISSNLSLLESEDTDNGLNNDDK